MLQPKDLDSMHLHVTQKKIFLPQGHVETVGSLQRERRGEGVAVFLYTPPTDDDAQFKIMSSKTNFVNMNNAIYYYYHPIMYKGHVGGLTYRVSDDSRQSSLYKRLKSVTGPSSVHPYPHRYISPSAKRSMYYDLSTHIDIFNRVTQKKNMQFVAESFWRYLDAIVNSREMQAYPTKFVIVNAADYADFNQGSIRSRLGNIIYMIYYSLYRNFDRMKGTNINFYFIAGNGFTLYINPSKCKDGDHRIFLREINKLMQRGGVVLKGELDENKAEKECDKEARAEAIVKNILEPETVYFSGEVKVDNPSNEKPTMVGFNNVPQIKEVTPEEELVNTITSMSDDDEDDGEKIDTADIANEKILDTVFKKTVKNRTPVRNLTPRDRELQRKQAELRIDNRTFAELKKINTADIEVSTNDISSSVRTPNTEMTTVKFANFDHDYVEKLMPKDLANTFTMFNDKSIPVFVQKVEKYDSSDELNYKDTYNVTLEDVNRKRHIIKVDIPKVIDGRYLYVGGNKKIVQKQNFLYPVVKTGPDVVQIVTNYNKMFLRRTEGRALSTLERFSRLIKMNQGEVNALFKIGNVSNANKDVVTTIEYDELASLYSEYNSNGVHLLFSQTDAKEFMDKNNLSNREQYLFIGTESGKPIYINTKSQRDDSARSIMDIIYSSLPEDLRKKYAKIRAPKRQMYAKVTTMEQDIPVSILMAYWVGLSELLKRADIKYEIVEKVPSELPPNKAFIPFADSTLVYEVTTPALMLLSGFTAMDTTRNNIADYDTEDPYLTFFKDVYGRTIIANSLMNVYEFTIDNITEEILIDLNLPTNLIDLMLYAIDLLSDNHYIPEIDQSQSRVRSMEIIPAILYYNLARAYTNFKNSGGKRKISVRRDCVIKDVLSLKTVEDVSVLNPFLEIERLHNISSKGWRGVNVDRAYTPERRSYVDSMIGIIAPSSSPDANVGLTRCLSLEPKIKSLRGYCDITDMKKDGDSLTAANLFSPTELLIPFAVHRDDPTRIGHMVKQSKHALPTVKSSPVLVSNGMEEVVRFRLSSDYAVNAELSGEVVEKDDETGLMVVRYEDGKYRAINLKSNIVKNGGGGFYMANQLTTDLEVGDKFKKNDPLAWNKGFFKKYPDGSTRMSVGSLQKIAVVAEYGTHEDATFITEKMSKDLGSEMTFCMSVVVGMNANVDFVAEEGAEIDVGDTLIQYDTSYDDSELNYLLSNLSTDDRLMETIMEDSRNNIKSKYAGVIESIKVYSTIDTSAMSPSLSKAVNKIYAKTKKRLNLLKKYDDESGIVKCGLLIDEPVGKVSPSKYGTIGGEKVDEGSVLFKFYIKHVEPLEVGSKIANHTALKNTICEIIPAGYEPYSSFRPEEEVSTIISCNSILNRMVPSILLSALANKCQIELKRKLKDIYYS